MAGEVVWQATWPWALLLIVGPPFYFLTETTVLDGLSKVAALVVFGGAS